MLEFNYANMSHPVILSEAKESCETKNFHVINEKAQSPAPQDDSSRAVPY
jgi:hypothetical protein